MNDIKCFFCKKPNATHFVHDRVEQELISVCDEKNCTNQANEIINKDYPEYQMECPNCGCELGVN